MNWEVYNSKEKLKVWNPVLNVYIIQYDHFELKRNFFSEFIHRNNVLWLAGDHLLNNKEVKFNSVLKPTPVTFEKGTSVADSGVSTASVQGGLEGGGAQ